MRSHYISMWLCNLVYFKIAYLTCYTIILANPYCTSLLIFYVDKTSNHPTLLNWNTMSHAALCLQKHISLSGVILHSLTHFTKTLIPSFSCWMLCIEYDMDLPSLHKDLCTWENNFHFNCYPLIIHTHLW